MEIENASVREQILRAGLKAFAERGYSGASVQDIIDATQVSKPVLYYYFGSKAGLYKALLDKATDECYQLMQEATKSACGVEQQLVEIFAAHFEFLKEQRDLLRLAFSAAFASPGELPPAEEGVDKGARNFEFVHTLIKQGQADGSLDPRSASLDLAQGIYAALCFHLMIGALKADVTMDRAAAEQIVQLYLRGAESKPTAKGGKI
ncbi:MAG: TetR/AcrR family transcriptional regulator [Verrucomicrobiales bacterium]